MQARTLFAALVAFCASAVGTVQAGTTNHPPVQAHREHRYLFIVETSKAMGKRTDGIVNAVGNLLASGFKGEVKQGDSVGIWTFNEALLTGKFPVRQLAPKTCSKAADEIVQFLRAQKFEHQGLPEKMLPTLGRVITNSPLITVVLISSGSTDLHGTGFDEKVNAVYRQWRDQQQQSKLPFVTLFRGSKGVLTECVASPAQWPVDLPPLPPEPIVQAKPEATATNLQAAVPRKPATTLPPLYFSGKKSEPQPAPKPSAAPTNAVVGYVIPLEEPNASKSVTRDPAGAVAQTVSSHTQAGSVPSQVAVAVHHEPEAVTNAPASTPPVAAAPSAAAEPSISKSAATLPASMAGAKDSRDEPPAKTEAGVAPVTAHSDPARQTVASRTADAAQPQSGPDTAHVARSAFLVLAGVLGCAAVMFLVVWVPRALKQRARHAAHVSLITRSLDRTTH